MPLRDLVARSTLPLREVDICLTHREADPTSVVGGWVGIRAIEIEVVRVINIRISGTRPIVASTAHVPQGASI